MATCEGIKRNGEVCGRDISKKPCGYHKKAVTEAAAPVEAENPGDVSFDDVTDFVSSVGNRLKSAGTEPIRQEAKSWLRKGLAKAKAVMDEIDPQGKGS